MKKKLSCSVPVVFLVNLMCRASHNQHWTVISINVHHVDSIRQHVDTNHQTKVTVPYQSEQSWLLYVVKDSDS